MSSFVRRHRVLLAILTIAFVLRAVVFAAHFLRTEGRAEWWEYERVVENILAGRGYVIDHLGAEFRCYQVPGYILFCAGLRLLGGGGPWLVFVGQVLLGAILVGLTYMVAVRWLDERSALAAGILSAVEPTLLVYGSYKSVSLVLAAPLAMLSLCLFLEAVDRRSAKLSAGSGVVLGLGILTRPDVGALLASMAACGMAGRGAPRMARLALLSAATAVIVVLPWLVRNRLVCGRWILQTDSTYVLWLGNNPGGQRADRDGRGGPPLEQALLKMERSDTPRTESGRYQWFLGEVARWAQEAPAAFLWGLVKKAAAQWWFPGDFATRHYEWVPRRAVLLYEVLYAALLTLAFAGFIYAARSPEQRFRRLALASGAYFAAFTALHSLFIAAGRHKVMILPLIAVFAGHGLARCAGDGLKRFRGGRR